MAGNRSSLAPDAEARGLIAVVLDIGVLLNAVVLSQDVLVDVAVDLDGDLLVAVVASSSAIRASRSAALADCGALSAPCLARTFFLNGPLPGMKPIATAGSGASGCKVDSLDWRKHGL